MALSDLMAGAGGAQGLEQLLTRRLYEAQLAESVRQHQAQEDIYKQNLAATEKDRQDRLQEQQRQHDLANQVQQENITMRRVALRSPGSLVTAPEFTQETQYGIPSANYQQDPGYQEPPQNQAAGFVGPRAPERPISIKWLGTEPQLQKQQESERRQEDLSRKTEEGLSKMQQAGAMLDLKAKQLELTGQLNEAKIAKMQAEALKIGHPNWSAQGVEQTKLLYQIDDIAQELKGLIEKRGLTTTGKLEGIKSVPGVAGAKLKALGQHSLYASGIAQDDLVSKTNQLAGLLKVLGVGPYLRGVRRFEFVKQAQEHLSDPSSTPASIYQRVSELTDQVLPTLYQGIKDIEENKSAPPSLEQRRSQKPNEGAGAGGGISLPQVGDTFQGGRVTGITRIR